MRKELESDALPLCQSPMSGNTTAPSGLLDILRKLLLYIIVATALSNYTWENPSSSSQAAGLRLAWVLRIDVDTEYQDLLRSMSLQSFTTLSILSNRVQKYRTRTVIPLSTLCSMIK